MESANSRFLTLISENDNYAPARQNRHYTNGLFLSYGLAKGQQAPWLNWLGNLTPLADRIKDREYNIALGQNLLHNVTGDPEPLGWRNQLENEPALLLRYRRSWFTPLVKNQPVNLDRCTASV